MEIVMHDAVDALTNEKAVFMIDVKFDVCLWQFFKDNPTIAKCLDTSMLLQRGKGKIKGQKSVFLGGVPYIGAKVPCFYMCPIAGETYRAGEELFCNYEQDHDNYVSLDEQDFRFISGGTSKYIRPLAFQEKQLENERKKVSKEEAQVNLEGLEQTINDANELGLEFASPGETLSASGSTPVAGPKTKVPKNKRKDVSFAEKDASSAGKRKRKRKKKDLEVKTPSGFPSSRSTVAERATAEEQAEALAKLTSPPTDEQKTSSK
jgi:hypothetical protein